MNACVLVVLVGVLSGIGWWLHRRCKAYIRAMVIKITRLRVSNQKLHQHNLQLQKQIEVRQSWQMRHLNHLRPQLNQLKQQAEQQQWCQGAVQAIKIANGLELLNCLASQGSHVEPFSYHYRMCDIIVSVRACWQHEFARAGIRIKRHIMLDTEMIELRDWGSDIIFNAVFALALCRLGAGQTLHIDVYVKSGRVMVRFFDEGVSCVRLSRLNVVTGDGTQVSVSTLTQRTGGVLFVSAAQYCNLIELSWPLAGSEHSVNDTNSSNQRLMSLNLEWLAHIEQLIALHYADPEFSTARAASLVYLSERSLQRRFKQLCGQTFKEYLIRYRLQQACYKLQQGVRVAQVAFECGFNDPSYFSQRFRLYYGLSPSQYSKQGSNQAVT